MKTPPLGPSGDATPIGPIYPQAPVMKGSAPVVDKLTVQVLVDSFHQALAPGFDANGLQVRRTGFNLSPLKPPSRTLWGEFGLSLFCNSHRGDEERRVMIDFAYTPECVINNIDILGLDVGSLDAMVLSHGHFDHYGGMIGMLQHYDTDLPDMIPLYMGGMECFCERAAVFTDPPAQFGTLDVDALNDCKPSVLYAEKPAIIADHAFTTGHIKAASFEAILAPTRMAPAFSGKFEPFDPLAVLDSWSPDGFDHELSTCYVVGNRGLVVTTSCGHRGVVNSIRRAQAVTGVDKVLAVLGGFHLQPHDRDYVRRVVEDLCDVNPEYVIPMHCTGDPFSELVQELMPGKLVRSFIGSSFTFEA